MRFDGKRLLAGACLAGMALAGPLQAQEKKAARNYDARVGRNTDFRAPLDGASAAAVAELKKGLPDLLVSQDAALGTVRTLTNASGPLTGPRAGEPSESALAFVQANLALLGLSPQDLDDLELTDSVYSDVSGVTHLYWRQRHAGLPVYNGQLHVNVGADGRILNVNNLFVPNLASAVNATQPRLGAAEAVAKAAAELGLQPLAEPSVASAADGPQQASLVEAPGLSQERIEAKLMLLPVRRGEARLVWNFNLYLPTSDHWYDLTIDAQDGQLWTRIDWVADANDYNVYPKPQESPNHTTPWNAPPTPFPPLNGPRTLVNNPANVNASPFGWHDTNGVAGAEFTVTNGNNVEAYTDTDANNTPDPGSEPDCGASLVCNFPLDLTQPPSAYRPAAVANLFYWNNIVHDVMHRYGFDEAGGNFQVNNYGHGGLGNDSVQAEAQDGSGTNNANFGTPPDGSRPRMQMYVWTAPTPDKDGDLDSGIISHEYGHGISNRLVGGPANVSCLGNNQQPGEGLSDWWSLFLTHEPGDTGLAGRGIGTYALNQNVDGIGIRQQKYSTDNAVNTWTYASINGAAIPHGVGSRWAQAYWEVYWKLVDQWGFDPDLYNATGSAGNQRANLYIIQGLKNTICSPAFTDVRDGIIAAATSLHGGEDVCRMWEAFAAYGLGTDAVSGGPNSTTPTNGFSVPVACLCTPPSGPPTGVTVVPNGNNRLDVSWTAPVSGAASYDVRRALGACPGSGYTTIASNVLGTTFADTTVSGGSTYSYVIVAKDATGNCVTTESTCAQGTATGLCTLAPTFAGLASATSASTGACGVDLGWSAGTNSCGTGVRYNVYRSTTPAFTPGPSNLLTSCLTGTSYSDPSVAYGSTYYYAVRAEDNSGNGTGLCASGNEDTNAVLQSAFPVGASATVNDDVEGSTGNWSTAGGTGANVWAVVTTAAHSPTHAWFVADPASVSDQRLATVNAGQIPAAFVMSFWNRYNTEAGTTATVGYDGGVLEYSTNGSTWFDILAGDGGSIPANAARFLSGGYTRTISSSFGSPLAGRQAWSGDNLAFEQVQVDMADFSGSTVYLRFRFASDSSVADAGWWVDDIVFRTAGPCTACAVTVIKGDFNGGSKVDLVFRNQSSNRNMVWLMDGVNRALAKWVTPDPSAATLQPVGSDDFNADGKTDLLFWNNTSGALEFWLMNGANRVGAAQPITGAPTLSTNWKLAATGDFNADGRPDLLWRNYTSQKLVVWTMNGTAKVGNIVPVPDQAVDVNWEVVAALDYNNDGNRDLLWYNYTSGKIVMWFMDASVQRILGQFTVPANAGDNNWRVYAGGDYGVGTSGTACTNDIVWRNATSGKEVVWFMDFTGTRTAGVFTSPDSPTTDPDGNATAPTAWIVAGPR